MLKMLYDVWKNAMPQYFNANTQKFELNTGSNGAIDVNIKQGTANVVNNIAPVAQWTEYGESQYDNPQTITVPGESGKSHYITGIIVCTSGSQTTTDIQVTLLDGPTQTKLKTIIGNGEYPGAHREIILSQPILISPGSDVTLDIMAGGAGVVTYGTLIGFTQ